MAIRVNATPTVSTSPLEGDEPAESRVIFVRESFVSFRGSGRTERQRSEQSQRTGRLISLILVNLAEGDCCE